MKTCLMLVISLIGAASIAKARTFTSSDGRKLEAELVSVEGEVIILKRSQDGQLFRLPIGKLSAEDQAFVRQNASTSKVSPPVAPAASPGTAENRLPQVWIASKPVTNWQIAGAAWLHLRLPRARGGVSAEVLARYDSKSAADSLKQGLKSTIENFLNSKPGDFDPLTNQAFFAWGENQTTIEFGLPITKKSSKNWPADTGKFETECSGLISITSRRPGEMAGFRTDSGMVNFDLSLEGAAQPDGTVRGKAVGRIFFDHDSSPGGMANLKSSGQQVFEGIEFVLSRMR
jgi:hypothetical protein